MHKDFKPSPQRISYAERRGEQEGFNQHLAAEINRDNNTIRNGTQFTKLSDFYRKKPAGHTDSRLLGVVYDEHRVKDHSIKVLYPINMNNTTREKLFHDNAGEVHIDEKTVLILRKAVSQLMSVEIHEGTLPEYMTPVLDSQYTSAERLAEALVTCANKAGLI